MDSPLLDLLRRCTVRITIAQRQGHGSGFFVAPGVILTCAHVVEAAYGNNRTIEIHWQDNTYPAQITHFMAKPYPDLSLLKVNLPEHPCVLLFSDIKLGDDLYAFGYPDSHPNGDPITGEYEGLTGGPVQLLKLKKGEIRRGLSGSPLLNQRTGGVCGIIKISRDPDGTDLGGRAVPTEVILSRLELIHLQTQFHKNNNEWSNCFLLDVLTTKISHSRFEKLVSKIFGRKVLDKLIGYSQFDKANACLEMLNQLEQKEDFYRILTEIEPDLDLSILGRPVKVEQGIKEPTPTDFIEFANREEEWKNVVLYPEGQYYLFEGPAGYGKTALLDKIDKEFNKRNWCSIYVSLKEQDNYLKITKYIAEKLTLDIEDNIYSESPWRIGLELGKAMIRQHKSWDEGGVALLLDVDHNPDEDILYALRIMIAEVIPANYDGLVRNSQYFKTTPLTYRVAIAGRYLTSIIDTFANQRYIVTQLKPFGYGVVRDICRKQIEKYIEGPEDLDEFAANLLFYSGGHPRCIVRILEKFKKVKGAPSNFFYLHNKQVRQDAEEEAVWVHHSIKYDYRSIFDLLCIYRRLDLQLLKQFLGRFGRHGDEYDLRNELLGLYLLSWADEGHRHLSDDITRRLLVIRLRSDFTAASAFRNSCQEAETFCLSRIKDSNDYRQYWAVEALYEFLQGHVFEIGDKTKRQSLRHQFFSEELPKVLGHLVEGCSDSRSEQEPLLGALSRERDWEFRFTVNYYLRNEVYNETPFQELIAAVKQFFKEQIVLK